MQISSAHTPLVSVIIPAYNATAFLGETLDSVLAQTYKNLEIIVVDDGSTDTTPQLLDSYGDQIHVLHQANAGQAAARNNGARSARGELLAFLDSDDLWDSDKIAHQVNLLARFPKALATYCDYRTIDSQGHLLTTSAVPSYSHASGDILMALLLGCCIMTPGLVLLRRNAFEATGGFDEATSMRGHEDYALWLRLATQGPFVFSPDTLASYRRHKQQATRQRHFWFEDMRAKLHGLTAIQSVVQTDPDEHLKHLFKCVLSESYVRAAWAARQMGDYADARRTATAALMQWPTSPRVWRSLAAALIPHWRVPKKDA